MSVGPTIVAVQWSRSEAVEGKAEIEGVGWSIRFINSVCRLYEKRERISDSRMVEGGSDWKWGEGLTVWSRFGYLDGGELTKAWWLHGLRARPGQNSVCPPLCSLPCSLENLEGCRL